MTTLTIEQQQQILFAAIRDMRTDMHNEFGIVKHRLASLEEGQAGILSFIASHDARIAAQHLAYDRLSERVNRIERRLELATD